MLRAERADDRRQTPRFVSGDKPERGENLAPGRSRAANLLLELVELTGIEPVTS